MRRIIILATCLITSFTYSFRWSEGNNPLSTYYSEKPFVYRQLVPIIADLLPFDKTTSVSAVVLVFCVGLAAIMLYLYESFWKISLRNDAIFVLIFASILMILTPYKKYYDVPTAFFFLLIFMLWVNGKFIISIPVFALACLNRETTLLLIPIFVVLFSDGIKKVGYSVFLAFVYIASRMLTFPLGEAAGGKSIYIRPMQNIYIHLQELAGTIILIVSLSLLLTMFLGNLRIMDKSIATFSLLLFPILVFLYIMSGYPFEVRVFAEVMPTLFMGAFLK